MLNGFTNCGRGTVKFCWNTATVICFHIIWLLFHCPWHSPGKKTGSPPPGIFPPQGLNRSLVHCGQIPYHLSHQGSPLLTIPFKGPTYHHLWVWEFEHTSFEETQTFRSFSNFLLLLVCNFIPLWSKNMICMNSIMCIYWLLFYDLIYNL